MFIYLPAESNIRVSALERGSCWGSLLLFQLCKLTSGKGEQHWESAENWRKLKSCPSPLGNSSALHGPALSWLAQAALETEETT